MERFRRLENRVADLEASATAPSPQVSQMEAFYARQDRSAAVAEGVTRYSADNPSLAQTMQDARDAMEASARALRTGGSEDRPPEPGPAIVRRGPGRPRTRAGA